MQLDTSSSFIKYVLTPEEFKAGVSFTTEQRSVIQNIIADCAEEKVTLTYNPSDPLKFTQAEAELQGKIGILKYLLTLESQLPEVS